MPCFHPENVMFVTNKWKIAAMQTKQAELNNMWETLPSKLKDIWPVVNKEHIFRIDLHEVMSVVFCYKIVCSIRQAFFHKSEHLNNSSE